MTQAPQESACVTSGMSEQIGGGALHCLEVVHALNNIASDQSFLNSIGVEARGGMTCEAKPTNGLCPLLRNMNQNSKISLGKPLSKKDHILYHTDGAKHLLIPMLDYYFSWKAEDEYCSLVYTF